MTLPLTTAQGHILATHPRALSSEFVLSRCLQLPNGEISRLIEARWRQIVARCPQLRARVEADLRGGYTLTTRGVIPRVVNFSQITGFSAPIDPQHESSLLALYQDGSENRAIISVHHLFCDLRSFELINSCLMGQFSGIDLEPEKLRGTIPGRLYLSGSVAQQNSANVISGLSESAVIEHNLKQREPSTGTVVRFLIPTEESNAIRRLSWELRVAPSLLWCGLIALSLLRLGKHPSMVLEIAVSNHTGDAAMCIGEIDQPNFIAFHSAADLSVVVERINTSFRALPRVFDSGPVLKYLSRSGIKITFGVNYIPCTEEYLFAELGAGDKYPEESESEPMEGRVTEISEHSPKLRITIHAVGDGPSLVRLESNDDTITASMLKNALSISLNAACSFTI